MDTLVEKEDVVLQKADHAPCFRVANYSAVSCVLLLIALFAVGCSTANVQHDVSYEVQLERKPDIPQTQADFLEFGRYYLRGGGVIIFGNLVDVEIEKAFFLEEEFEAVEDRETNVNNPEPEQAQLEASVNNPEPDRIQRECHYQAELAGRVWLSVPEPELIEDRLIPEFCIEDAHPWCDPAFEETYLSYLELEKRLRFEASIFPNFVSPVDNGLVLRGMQAPTKKRRGHYGVDIIPASWEGRGTPIKAVEDGTVVRSGRAGGYGYYAVVYHQNGLFSLYSHLLKSGRLQVGQEVQRGDPVGMMGKSGNARGYHLHFELIDLREVWNLAQEIDPFIEDLTCNCVQKHDVNQFCKLLFSKKAKQDPLPHIPGLAMAKKVNGKWVAVPMEEQKNAQAQTAAKK